MPASNTDQVNVFDHLDALREAKKRAAIIAFVVGVACTLATLWMGAWFGRTVHISDDFNYGRSWQDTVDCETLAEAVYGHDIRVLASDRLFDGWAPRAEQNFLRGCLGDGPIGGSGGSD